MDYPVSSAQRRCAATGRDLHPGEAYYGVLLESPAGLTRSDYAAEAWPGPPEKAVGYWSGRVPETGTARKHVMDLEAIHANFLQMEGDEAPARVNFRYVLALILIRRKRLRLESTDRGPAGPVLKLVDPKTNDRHEVRDPQLTNADLTEVQEEVFRVLGWNS